MHESGRHHESSCRPVRRAAPASGPVGARTAAPVAG